MTLYVRVKNKTTGHEFDLPTQNFDPEVFSKVTRYPETTRPRRPKLNVRVGGKRIAPVKTDKE